jgi:DNA-binding transcriptional ArsR family regulator
MIEALASETPRTILDALSEEPKPESALAEAASTSLQNVTYHLNQLVDAGLVQGTDTHDSSRGLEMDVYAPVSDPVVICLGDHQHVEVVSSAVKSVLEVHAKRVGLD